MFHILFQMYICWYYLNKDKMTEVLKLLKEAIQSNSILRKEFEAKKAYYLEQFAYGTNSMNDL
jgi:predicted Zn-dependent peptidase